MAQGSTRPTTGARIAVVLAVVAASLLAVAQTSAADVPDVWTPPAAVRPATASYLYAEPTGAPGYDEPASRTHTDLDSDFRVTYQDGRAYIHVEGRERWTISLRLPGAPRISPGTYDLPRGFGRNDPDGFDLTGDGSGSCTRTLLAVDRADYVGDELTHLAMRFDSDCSVMFNSGMRGELVLDRTAPLPPAMNPSLEPAGTWHPPAGATPATGNHLYAVGTEVEANPYLATDASYSQRIDFGGGRAAPDGLAFNSSGPGGSRLMGTITGPTRSAGLEVGYYGGLWGVPNRDPLRGGMSITVGSHSCEATAGSWFAIDELTKVAGRITHIVLRFQRNCESPSGDVAHVVRGQLVWTLGPTITEVLPSYGGHRGGDVLDLKGELLDDVTAVSIGGVPAEVRRSATGGLQVVVPPLPIGAHQFDVTTPAGTFHGAGREHYEAQGNGPLAPNGVAVTPGPGFATVSWTPPSDLGDGPLRMVLVTLYDPSDPTFDPDDNDSEQRGAATTHVTDRSIVMADLDPGRTYVAIVRYVNEFQNGPPSEPSAPFVVQALDVAPFDDLPEFVTQQYVDFAGRAPTAAERASISTSLRTGRTTPDAWVASMRNRPEWKTPRDQVVRLYESYLRRLPTAPDLATWVAARRRGTSLEAMSAFLWSDRTVQQRYAKLTATHFVDRLYLDVLHRPGTAAGRAGWLAKMKKGMSRSAVVTGFSESAEHVRGTQRTVDTVLLYAGLLRRMPTTAELSRPAGTRAATPTTAPVDPVAVARALRLSRAYAARF